MARPTHTGTATVVSARENAPQRGPDNGEFAMQSKELERPSEACGWEADLIAHYEASGFPTGRVPAIARAWAERTAATPVLDEWYRYLTQT